MNLRELCTLIERHIGVPHVERWAARLRRVEGVLTDEVNEEDAAILLLAITGAPDCQNVVEVVDALVDLPIQKATRWDSVSDVPAIRVDPRYFDCLPLTPYEALIGALDGRILFSEMTVGPHGSEVMFHGLPASSPIDYYITYRNPNSSPLGGLIRAAGIAGDVVLPIAEALRDAPSPSERAEPLHSFAIN